MTSILSSMNISSMQYGENSIASAKDANLHLVNKKQGFGMTQSVNGMGLAEELVKGGAGILPNIGREGVVVQISDQSKSVNEIMGLEKKQMEVRQQEQQQASIGKIEASHQKIKIYSSVQEQNFPKGTISEYV